MKFGRRRANLILKPYLAHCAIPTHAILHGKEEELIQHFFVQFHATLLNCEKKTLIYNSIKK